MNTFVFNLNVTCTRNPEAVKGETDPKKLYLNEAGTSSSFPSPFPFPLSLSPLLFCNFLFAQRNRKISDPLPLVLRVAVCSLLG